MVGTFSTTNSADAEYLVFHDDGICGQYRQFGPVEDGTYRSEGSLVTLSFEQGDFHAVYTDGRLYVFAQDKNNVITFSKISNTPTFINTLLRLSLIHICNVIVLLLDLFSHYSFSYWISFVPALIFQGQIWRLVTFIFVPLNENLLWFLFSVLLYYSIGRSLEQSWGATKFTVYYLSLIHI